MKTILSAISILLITIYFSNALDEEAAKERKCFDTKVSKDVDWDWLFSTKKWYYPVWSKLELYRTASDIMNRKISEINESEFSSSCLSIDNNFIMAGFNQKVAYNLTLLGDKSFYFKALNGDFVKSGKHYLTLTDNKTFAVGISCWEDNESAWSVWSPTPQLTEETKKIAEDYLVSLGFSMDFAVETPFANCTEV